MKKGYKTNNRFFSFLTYFVKDRVLSLMRELVIVDRKWKFQILQYVYHIE